VEELIGKLDGLTDVMVGGPLGGGTIVKVMMFEYAPRTVI
jgi:hypothetical protein